MTSRTPTTAERRQADEDGRHIKFAIGKLIKDDGLSLSDGPEIVRRLLVIAVSIDRTERRVLPALPGNTWPTILREDFASDGDFGVSTEPTVTGGQRGLLDGIGRTFRAALRECRCGKGDACHYECGVDPDRDFRVLWDWASGESPRWIAKHWGEAINVRYYRPFLLKKQKSHNGKDGADKISHQRVRLIIGRCCWIIWMAIKHHVPAPASPSSMERDRAPVTWR
jgi:hypothetical protein